MMLPTAKVMNRKCCDLNSNISDKIDVLSHQCVHFKQCWWNLTEKISLARIPNQSSTNPTSVPHISYISPITSHILPTRVQHQSHLFPTPGPLESVSKSQWDPCWLFKLRPHQTNTESPCWAHMGLMWVVFVGKNRQMTLLCSRSLCDAAFHFAYNVQTS